MDRPRRLRLSLVLGLLAVALVAVLGFVVAGRLAGGGGAGQGGTAGGRSLTLVDDVGRRVTLTLPVRRTVVFNRYDAEFVRAVAGMDRIVGLDGGTAKERDYWPKATPAMVAGQGQTEIDYEKVVALRPDLVLIPRNGDWKATEAALAPFHIPVVVLTGWDVLKHERNVDQLGQIYGEPARAAALNAFYRRYRDLLHERLAGVARRRVYLEEVGDYKTVLQGSGWHDMIELAGGENVFADVQIEAGKAEGRGAVQGFVVDPEAIVSRRPDVIIKLEPGRYAPWPADFSRDVLGRLVARPGFSRIPAVRDGEVYHMSYYLAGGCSKVIGALQIAKWLYPDRFADIDPDAVMGEWLTRFQGVPYPGGYWTSIGRVRP